MRKSAFAVAALLFWISPAALTIAQPISLDFRLHGLVDEVDQLDSDWLDTLQETTRDFGFNSAQYTCNEAGYNGANKITSSIMMITELHFMLEPISSNALNGQSRKMYDTLIGQLLFGINSGERELKRTQVICQGNAYLQSASEKFISVATRAVAILPELKAKYGGRN